MRTDEKICGRQNPTRSNFERSIAILSAMLALQMLTPPQVAGEFDRWIHLEGAVNFRDVGGYDAGTTATVATGFVYRSDHLHNLTTTDTQIIRSLGVHIIIDFRELGDACWEPDSGWFVYFASHVYIPIFPHRYQMLALERDTQWRLMFTILADPANLPLDYHCSMGKDRAGIMTALLLTLLGVDRETVIQDYLLSGLVHGPGSVDRAWIEEVFTEIDNAGGIDSFLDEMGVGPSVRQAVRANLLVPRPPATTRGHWELYR